MNHTPISRQNPGNGLPSLVTGSKRKRLVATGAALALLMMSGAHARTWTSADGSKTFQGELKSYDAPVLLIKACIGNLSLGWDLLPPGSEPYESGGKTVPGYRGTPGNPKGNGEKVGGEWFAFHPGTSSTYS